MSQIRTHSANGRNYLIVQVPKDAYQFELINNRREKCELLFLEDKGIKIFHPMGDVLLPNAKYKFLFIAEDATEEQAKTLCIFSEFANGYFFLLTTRQLTQQQRIVFTSLFGTYSPIQPITNTLYLKNMKQINSNGHTWLFVPVLNGADNFCVHKRKIYYSCFVFREFKKIPAGEWLLHCHSNTVTEEQAAEIVTNEGTEKQPMYTDYTHPFSGYTNAIPSLATLVDAHDITTPYIVLKLKQDAPVQVEQTKRKRKTKKTSK